MIIISVNTLLGLPYYRTTSYFMSYSKMNLYNNIMFSMTLIKSIIVCFQKERRKKRLHHIHNGVRRAGHPR